MKNTTIEYPNYVDVFKRHVGAVIYLLHWFITFLADNLVDIAARALAFTAPLPNAISVYKITIAENGFVWWQAGAFALTLELVIFAVLEITMHMWDGYLDDKERYERPLFIAVCADVLVLFIVIGLVWYLERSFMAVLPLISASSFVSLALKRWHDRGISESENEPKTTIVPEVENEDEQRNERRKNVVLFYADNPNASYNDAAEHLNVSKSVVYNDVRWLSKNDVLDIEKNGRTSTISLNGKSAEFLG